MAPEETARFDRIEQLLTELVERQTVRQWYSVEQFAKQVSRSTFQVRQWANLGRINATKSAGRCGPEREWVIEHAELLRYQQHRLLPLDPARNNPDRVR